MENEKQWKAIIKLILPNRNNFILDKEQMTQYSFNGGKNKESQSWQEFKKEVREYYKKHYKEFENKNWTIVGCLLKNEKWKILIEKK